MAALNDCIAAVREASGGALDDKAALELLDQVRQRREQLAANGTIDRIDRRLRALAAQDAERAQIMAALARKHAVLSALARRRVQDAVLAHVDAGLSYRKAVLAVLEGTERAVEGGRHSVAATNLAYEARYLGGLMGRIAQERPHLERRLGDEKLMADATRLMFGERVDNADPDARWLADLLGEYAELSRQDLNGLGAAIGKLDGWVPQGHMDWRLLQIDQADWVGFIRPMLDLERTFPDVAPDAIDDILGDIYTTITTGRDIDPKPDAFRGPANVARSLGKHRVLHFANADAYMAYNQRFGFGNLFTAMESHLRKAARLAAQMDVLGPNPGHTLDNLLDGLIARVQRDTSLTAKKKRAVVESLKRGQSNAEGGRGGSIGSAYAVVSGLSAVPDHWGLAQAGSTFRALQSMAKLGSAVITAIADLGTLVMNLNYQGKAYPDALADVMGGMVAGRGKGEARAIAFGIGEGFDSIIGHLTSRYGVLDTMPGRVSRLMTHFFRWNGLSGWTDAARAVGVRVMAADMGRLSGQAFGALPAKYQRVLRVHGIDAAQWDLIRATAWKGDNGRRYVTPDRLEALPAEEFDRLIDGPANAKTRAAMQRQLSIALRRFFADEAVFGVIEVDASTQRFATGGSRKGTLGGEAVRFVMQFKGFPVAFTKRTLGRAIGGASGSERAFHVAKLVATLTAAGYASQAARDFLRGRDPKRPGAGRNRAAGVAAIGRGRNIWRLPVSLGRQSVRQHRARDRRRACGHHGGRRDQPLSGRDRRRGLGQGGVRFRLAECARPESLVGAHRAGHAGDQRIARGAVAGIDPPVRSPGARAVRPGPHPAGAAIGGVRRWLSAP